MDDLKFSEVDSYFINKLVGNDIVLDHVLENNERHHLPPYDVTPSQGKLLYLLTKMTKAERVLEIGTLGGYSTIWFARALPKDGYILSLEYSELYATVAKENIANAGFSEQVDIIQGAAIDSMNVLITNKTASFDLIFIDADKPNNPHYLDLALKLSKPGTVIIGDNVVREGEVVNSKSGDDRVKGVQRFTEQLSRETNIESTCIQTVGMKGYDGFTLSIVTE